MKKSTTNSNAATATQVANENETTSTAWVAPEVSGAIVVTEVSELETLRAELAAAKAQLLAKKSTSPRTTLRFKAIAAVRVKLAAGESKDSVTEFINTNEEYSSLFTETKSVRVVQEVPMDADARAKTITGILNMVRGAKK